MLRRAAADPLGGAAQVDPRAAEDLLAVGPEAAGHELVQRLELHGQVGGTVTNGDFEQSGGWSYSQTNDPEWKGGRYSADVRSGTRSHVIYHGYKKTSVAGSWGQVSQTVALGSP